MQSQSQTNTSTPSNEYEKKLNQIMDLIEKKDFKKANVLAQLLAIEIADLKNETFINMVNLVLAQTFIQTQQYDDAITIYSNLIKKKPYDPKLYKARADLYILMGDEEANTDLQTVESLEPIQLSLMSIDLDDDEQDESFKKARDLEARGKHLEATNLREITLNKLIQKKETLLKENKDNIHNVSNLQAIANINNQMGIIYTHFKKLSLAINHYKEAVKFSILSKDEDLWAYCFNHILISSSLTPPEFLNEIEISLVLLAKSEEFKKIIRGEAFTSFTAKVNRFIFILINRLTKYAHLFSEQSNFKFSIISISNAILLAKNIHQDDDYLASLYKIMGVYHTQAYKFSDAIQAFSSALYHVEKMENPSRKSIMLQKIYLDRGLTYEKQDDFRLAINDYLSILKIDKDHKEANRFYYRALFGLRLKEDAAQDEKKTSLNLKQLNPILANNIPASSHQTTVKQTKTSSNNKIKPALKSEPKQDNLPVKVIKTEAPIKKPDEPTVTIEQEKQLAAKNADKLRKEQAAKEKSLEIKRAIEQNKREKHQRKNEKQLKSYESQVTELKANIKKLEKFHEENFNKIQLSIQKTEFLLVENLQEDKDHLALKFHAQALIVLKSTLTEQINLLQEIKNSITFDNIYQQIKMVNTLFTKTEQQQSSIDITITTIEQYIPKIEEQIKAKLNKMHKDNIESIMPYNLFETLLDLRNKLQARGVELHIRGGAAVKFLQYQNAKTESEKKAIKDTPLKDIDLTIECKSVYDPDLIAILSASSLGFKPINENLHNINFANYQSSDGLFDLTLSKKALYQSDNPIHITRAKLKLSDNQLIPEPNDQVNTCINNKIFDIDLPDEKSTSVKCFFSTLIKNIIKFKAFGFSLSSNTQKALYDTEWQKTHFLTLFQNESPKVFNVNHPCIAEMADLLKKGYFVLPEAKTIICSFIETTLMYFKLTCNPTLVANLYDKLKTHYGIKREIIRTLNTDIIKNDFLKKLQEFLDASLVAAQDKVSINLTDKAAISIKKHTIFHHYSKPNEKMQNKKNSSPAINNKQ